MPECGYCKDCKWWDRWNDGEWGDCLYTHADWLEDQTAEGRLRCNEKHGCVQFEVKDA